MTQNARNWEPKVIGNDDRELLYRSRELFFGAREEAYVDYLYFDNPAGSLYGYFAMDGDTIAGQYIIIPVNMLIDGEPVTATLSLDTFTHADYRRQGIFEGLANRVYDLAKQQGSAFTIGLPNQYSRPGLLNKLSFIEPFTVVQSMRPLSLTSSWGKTPRTILARLPFGLVGAVAGKTARIVFEVTDAPAASWLEVLWDRYKTQHAIELFKDAPWVKWRYIDNPKFRYRFLTATSRNGEPLGYVVWTADAQHKLNRKNITLIDIVAVDLAAYGILMQAFLNEVAGEADIVKAMYTPLSAYGSVLMAFGFVPYKKASFTLRFHDDTVDLRRFYRRGRWHVSGCYADFL